MLLNSKYPILAMPLNPLSDGKFAVACAGVGIFPSLTMFAFEDKGGIDYHKLTDDLKLFNDANCGKLMVSMPARMLADKALMVILRYAGVELIEVLLPPTFSDPTYIVTGIDAYRSNGVKVLIRSSYFKIDGPYRGAWFPFVDGVIVKGKAGAGFTGDQTTNNLFTAIKENFSNLPLIVAGGIKTKRQINTYLNAGADAVAIGTLLSSAEELNISDELKKELATRNVVVNNDIKRPLKEIISELV